MGALNDIDLLTATVESRLEELDAKERECLSGLDTSGSTIFVNSLRIIRLERSIMFVGIFSMLEALLKAEFPTLVSFGHLRTMMTNLGQHQIAKDILHFQLAVNVLKHGPGSSHNKLIEMKDELSFKVKASPNEWFEKEGDIIEGQLLVDVTTQFVVDCTAAIRRAVEHAKSSEQHTDI